MIKGTSTIVALLLVTDRLVRVLHKLLIPHDHFYKFTEKKSEKEKISSDVYFRLKLNGQTVSL